MRESITAILFDWDGTLFDSAQISFLAFERVFRELAVPFSREAYESFYSPNWRAMYESLEVPGDVWDKADELWLRHYDESIPKMVDGAHDTLVSLKERGYQLGVVTSGTKRRVAREIEALSLSSVFGVVVCNEDVVNRKPHPEGLETAMARLAVGGPVCCYVGDAPEDIRMGRNARTLTIGVKSDYPTSKNLSFEQPDIQIEHITELLNHF